jgi:hypothetical protein
MELMRVLLLAVACGFSVLSAQDTTTVQWIALDASTGLPLSSTRFVVDGDTVRCDSSGWAETKHLRGSQTLSVQWPAENQELVRDTFSLDSTQEFAQFTLELTTNTTAKAATPNTAATPRADMVVVARRDPLHDRKEASKTELSREEMRAIAGVQNDPLQALRTEPGVAHQNDLNQRPHVRGGDWYETRVFWNGAPIIQPFHATSMFSIFNLEATEDMTFYSASFPVEGSNSLSGALFMRARPAPTDSFALMLGLSDKGQIWAGAPIVKDKFGVYFAYQAYIYDWVLKRLMDASTFVNDDPEYEEDVEEYKQYVEMPNFKDLQTGFTWNITPRLRMDYHYLRAFDVMRYVQPVTEEDELFKKKTKLDTIALVEIPNNVHGLNMRYAISDRWDVLFSNTLQMVDWQVQFGNAMEGYDPAFEYSRFNAHSRMQNYFRVNNQHLLQFGASFEKDRARYNVDMPRFAYELMMQSNMDMMENLGYYGEKGFSIVEGSAEDDWRTLLENVMMDYTGTRTRYTVGTWLADQWKVNADNRLSLGTRIDWEDVSHDVFLSPRVSWFHRVNVQHELTFSAGLYHQDNFEFYYRHLNPSLASEKCVHLNAEWSYDITPDYRMELMNYGKYYYDLASAQLVDYLDRSAKLYDSYGQHTLTYTNAGIGFAAGSELRLHYDPTSVWRGWISGEASLSKRKDSEDGIWYNFRRHRPWSIKWHNYFKMPSDWEFSVRYTYAGGMVYTGYQDLTSSEGASDGDTVFVVERKNSRRYSPYSRVDFRLEKNHTIFGHPALSYFEVWNAFNTPNFLLTDNETGQLKFYDLSYPMPVFYYGIEWRW